MPITHAELAERISNLPPDYGFSTFKYKGEKLQEAVYLFDAADLKNLRARADRYKALIESVIAELRQGSYAHSADEIQQRLDAIR